MAKLPNETVPAKTKGILGVGIFAALAKVGSLLFAHHGASAAIHVAEEAAPALVHAAPAITHDLGSMAAHGVAAASPNLVEDAAKTVGRTAVRTETMSDAERIARNAVGVAKGYAKQKARENRKDDESR